MKKPGTDSWVEKYSKNDCLVCTRVTDFMREREKERLWEGRVGSKGKGVEDADRLLVVVNRSRGFFSYYFFSCFFENQCSCEKHKCLVCCLHPK